MIDLKHRFEQQKKKGKSEKDKQIKQEKKRRPELTKEQTNQRL